MTFLSFRLPARALFAVSLVVAACGEPGITEPAADGAPPGPQFSAVTDNFFVSGGGSFFNVCTNEWVAFGEGAGFHIVIRSNQTPSGFQVAFHENGINLNGPGLDGPAPDGNPTGTQYQGMLSINEVWNAQPPYPQTRTMLLRIIVNATGELPDRVTYQKLHATINADGEVTALVAEPYRIECKG